MLRTIAHWLRTQTGKTLANIGHTYYLHYFSIQSTDDFLRRASRGEDADPNTDLKFRQTAGFGNSRHIRE